ncbi:MAG: hypothetical protein R3292_09475 [Alcanivorax sp.]|nr:hypothetical protein [Alcanivorax sp.]
MQFDKASTRNAWQAVAHITEQIRDGHVDPALNRWFEKAGFCLADTVFSSVCQFDDGVYNGTLIDGEQRAWEFFVDLSDPDACCLDDVTASLGPKSPDHPHADLRDLVTMALFYQRQQLEAA